MRLRFFADQCVPGEITDFLSERGFEVVLLRDVLSIRSPDSLVIKKAQEMEAVLLSLNGDFADIVAYPPRHFLGIVALQLHNHPETIPSLLHHFCEFLRAEPDPSFYAGKLLIVEVHRIRIRS